MATHVTHRSIAPANYSNHVFILGLHRKTQYLKPPICDCSKKRVPTRRPSHETLEGGLCQIFWSLNLRWVYLRTFPHHDFFTDGQGIGQENLFNVLKAYSLYSVHFSYNTYCIFLTRVRYDPVVGYCQGLPFIVAILLLNVRACFFWEGRRGTPSDNNHRCLMKKPFPSLSDWCRCMTCKAIFFLKCLSSNWGLWAKYILCFVAFCLPYQFQVWYNN